VPENKLRNKMNLIFLYDHVASLLYVVTVPVFKESIRLIVFGTFIMFSFLVHVLYSQLSRMYG
jgi:hypothetical protein